VYVKRDRVLRASIGATWVKEIICSPDTGTLWWLGESDSQRSPPLEIHVPTHTVGERRVSEEQLLKWGIQLRVHGDEEAKAMFCNDDHFQSVLSRVTSPLPDMSMYFIPPPRVDS
jgi:hypothetical protein